MLSKSYRKVSPSRVRPPTTGDRERIRAALDVALNLSLAQEGQIDSTVSYLTDDRSYLVETIVQREVDAVVIDNAYLLVYAIITPWYSKGKSVLHEDLVLRIGDGSDFSAVVGTLEDLAQESRCDLIIVGGALARSSRAITRLYRRHGFVPETHTPQLTKRR